MKPIKNFVLLTEYHYTCILVWFMIRLFSFTKHIFLKGAWFINRVLHSFRIIIGKNLFSMFFRSVSLPLSDFFRHTITMFQNYFSGGKDCSSTIEKLHKSTWSRTPNEIKTARFIFKRRKYPIWKVCELWPYFPFT